MPVLAILAVLWAVVLVPPLMRSRSHRSPSSIVDFNYKLDVLGRTNGNVDLESQLKRASAASRSSKRRRDVMRVLAVLIGATLLIAALSGAPVAWGLQLFSDVLMVVYLSLWAWLRTVQADRLEKVRYLPEPHLPRSRTPDFALRRSASS